MGGVCVAHIAMNLLSPGRSKDLYTRVWVYV